MLYIIIIKQNKQSDKKNMTMKNGLTYKQSECNGYNKYKRTAPKWVPVAPAIVLVAEMLTRRPTKENQTWEHCRK